MGQIYCKEWSNDDVSSVNYVSDCNFNVRSLQMFSNSCGEQNKNINMIFASLQTNYEERFDKTEHYFWMKNLKDREVYSMDLYAALIRKIKTTTPLNVVEMNLLSFYNLIELQQEVILQQVMEDKFYGEKHVFTSDTYINDFAIKPTHQIQSLLK